MLDGAAAVKLRAQLGPVSDAMWRDLLRECGVPLAPLVEGVRQDTFANLERTLLLLWQEYAAADREGRRQCRALVIEAKDHARLAARNPKVSEDKRQQKEEMLLWMLTWLENPGAFELWVGLRKQRLAATADQSTPPE
ncbi:MAG: hypothetical protein JNK87_42275 [Bryobacterales bacterium]|nr:hypothetical protein [Bryobacterales bacterium]